MVNTGLSNNTELVLSDPFPESNVLGDCALLDLLLVVKVEHLDHGVGTLGGSQSDDVLGSVHENAVSLHRLPLKCKILGGVNDCAVLLVLDANVLLTLKCDRAKLEEIWADTQVCKLVYFFEIKR